MHSVARNRLQERIAARTARERETARIEWVARDHFTKLITERMAFEVERVGRGPQALVARQHRAILLARELQHFGGAERMVVQDVGAEQPEPSRKPDEIAVGGEFWRLVHFCHRSPM